MINGTPANTADDFVHAIGALSAASCKGLLGVPITPGERRLRESGVHLLQRYGHGHGDGAARLWQRHGYGNRHLPALPGLSELPDSLRE